MRATLVRPKAFRLWIAAIAGLSACSHEPTPPEHLADVVAPIGTRAAFNVYRPGSILDEWMALDVETNGKLQSMVHIAYCDRAAARVSADSADVVVFAGSISVTAPHYLDTEPYDPSIGVEVKSFDRKPTPEELTALVDAGFTITTCPANKDSSE